ncbi:fungal-specific transcription factor domain-containing protein [Fusarium avenaceum]|nr:fungal-specific transcription factor domain-containing protein [Fusarium avenaceum]
MKPRRGCWTCTGRKIQCDGNRPTCNTCGRSQLICQGYEPRLSWPKDNDKKRAILCDSASHVVFSPNTRNIPDKLFFINTVRQDVELYQCSSLQTHQRHTLMSSPKSLKPPQLRAGQNDLFQYFHDKAHASLATFGMTPLQIHDLLMSMVLANSTTPDSALTYAIMAYSSLHRHGLNEEAMRLKIQAIRFLSTAAQERQMSSLHAAQHVATSMLLGSFENQLLSESSGEWLWHTWGAMDVIQATRLKDQSCQLLIDWASYHHTISQFSMRHWHHKSLASTSSTARRRLSQNSLYPPLTQYRPNPPSSSPTFAVLNLLSEACSTLVDSRDSISHRPDYPNSVQILLNKLEDISVTPVPTGTDPETAFAMNLYQVATRIYIARATASPSVAPAMLDSLIDALFDGPVKTCNCQHFFPLLILACEASKDEQRVAILNLIDRTQRDIRIRSIIGVTRAIQSIWVHQDLHADGDLLVKYLDLLSIGISSGSTILSLA